MSSSDLPKESIFSQIVTIPVEFQKNPSPEWARSFSGLHLFTENET